MKIKNKGKVYPSPSSSSSSSSSSDIDVLSVLKLLPAAILALVSVLSFEDREVLAYMITRSMKTSATADTTSSMVVQESKKKSSKKGSSNNNNNTHKPPVFDCDCFDCYRSYWLRWNSSSNRELMDQAIEAFEDQLTNGEKKKKKTQKSSGRGKKRERMGRREATKAADVKVQVQPSVAIAMPETVGDCGVVLVPVVNDVVPVSSLEKSDEGNNGKDDEKEVVEDMGGGEVSQAEEQKDEDMAVFVRTAATANNHKGLARKVLPDVLGLLNSRFWSLWGPNV